MRLAGIPRLFSGSVLNKKYPSVTLELKNQGYCTPLEAGMVFFVAGGTVFGAFLVLLFLLLQRQILHRNRIDILLAFIQVE
jgi:hypothetical protein